MIRRCFVLLFVAMMLQAAGAPRFEVASIRPHDPASPGAIMKFPRGGMVSISGLTIRNLIWLAWHLPPERVLGGPKWLDSDHYDIQAKSPAGAGTSQEDSFLRIRTLLAERLSLRVHTEKRDSPVYILSIAKNGLKMRPANGSGAPVRSGGSVLPWPMVVSSLSRRLGRPVIDRTGLKGAWYVNLLYTQDDGTPSSMGGVPAEGSPSIFTAVQEQLGLKLDAAKSPVEYLIVDSVSRPSPN